MSPDETTTASTTEATTTVDPNIQTQETAGTTENTMANANESMLHPVDAGNSVPATPTEGVPANAKPAGSASPAVENPANHVTTNDVTQTMEERQAEARSDAMTNHAAERAVNGQASDEAATEEQVA